jgi:hypothetical protein
MELSGREKRAIMLETQTPAYALTSEARRANDLRVRRANNLRLAFQQAGIHVPVSVRAIVPHQNRYVSGLNVPSNFTTLVGRDQLNAFNRTLKRAVKGLEARNA